MSAGITHHVENRGLFAAAAGDLALLPWERAHIHQCETCQGVFKVFLNQSVDVLPPRDRGEPAA